MDKFVIKQYSGEDRGREEAEDFVDFINAEFEKLQKIIDRIKNSVPMNEVFPNEKPGDILAGARYREGLTQKQLSELTGIPQGHISAMENGKREIGVKIAKKFGKALNVNYKVFL